MSERQRGPVARGGVPSSAGTKPGDESLEPLLGLFQGFGVELELMIVDARTLDVRPVADRLLAAAARGGGEGAAAPPGRVAGGAEAGEVTSEIAMGEIAWSNELALHVIELKTNGPAASLTGLAAHFQRSVERVEEILSGLGCRLMPGGAHPWMDPDLETRIWPHEYTEVYRTFDRIFSCQGHGWSNLQSTHLNLPFSDPREFAALHAAIRALLPLVPALTASTPVLDGRLQGVLDARMVHYARNAARVPSVTGRVIPEWVSSPADYDEAILGPIYRDLAPLDPAGILRHEWVNARGAIARFQRGTIEIRVVDGQECPASDLGVTALQAEAVRRLTAHALHDPEPFQALSTDRLAALLWNVVAEGEEARIALPELFEVLGIGPRQPLSAGEVWRWLADEIGWGAGEPLHEWRGPLHVLLEEGPLARRLLRALGPDPGRGRLRDVWLAMADCLRANVPFRGA